MGVMLSLGLLVILVLTVAWALFTSSIRSTSELPDGSTLSLFNLQYGTEVEVTDGALVSRLLQNVLPRGGLHIGGFHLSAPIVERYVGKNGNGLLFLELDAYGDEGTLPEIVTPSLLGEFRGVFEDASGFIYPQKFHDTNRARRGDLGKFICYSFPRRSADLSFHIQKLGSGEQEWKTLATLPIKNPAPIEDVLWTHPEVTTVETNGWTFNLGEVKVITHARALSDPVVPLVKLALSVVRDERWPAEWSIRSLRIEDQLGNSFFPQGAVPFGNADTVIGGEAVPDPSVMWKVDVVFRRVAPVGKGRSSGISVQPPSLFHGEDVYTVGGIPLTLRPEPKGRIRILAPVNGSDLSLSVRGLSKDSGRQMTRQPEAFRALEGPNEENLVEQVVWIPEDRAEHVSLAFSIANQPSVRFFVRPRLVEEVTESASAR